MSKVSSCCIEAQLGKTLKLDELVVLIDCRCSKYQGRRHAKAVTNVIWGKFAPFHLHRH